MYLLVFFSRPINRLSIMWLNYSSKFSDNISHRILIRSNVSCVRPTIRKTSGRTTLDPHSTTKISSTSSCVRSLSSTRKSSWTNISGRSWAPIHWWRPFWLITRPITTVKRVTETFSGWTTPICSTMSIWCFTVNRPVSSSNRNALLLRDNFIISILDQFRLINFDVFKRKRASKNSDSRWIVARMDACRSQRPMREERSPGSIPEEIHRWVGTIGSGEASIRIPRGLAILVVEHGRGVAGRVRRREKFIEWTWVILHSMNNWNETTRAEGHDHNTAR